MKILKSAIAGILILTCLSMGYSFDITGVYTGEIENEEWMVIVREIGTAVYFFELYELYDTTPSLMLKSQNDRDYFIQDDPVGAIVEFTEGECTITNPSIHETLTSSKLLGPEEEIYGVYQLSNPDEDEMILISIEEKDGASISLGEWYLIDSEYREADKDNRYSIDDGYSEYILRFNPDGTGVLGDYGEEYKMKKASTNDLYQGQRYIPVGGEGIAGFYRGKVGEGEAALITRSVGRGLYSFDFMVHDETIDFGKGKMREEGKIKQIELEPVLLTYTEDGLTLKDREYDETVQFEKISHPAESLSGLYFAEDPEYGYTMLLSIEEEEQYFNILAEIWEIDVHFDARANEENVYLYEEEYDYMLFGYAENICRMVLYDLLIPLQKIAAFEDHSDPDDLYSGIIPDLSLSKSVEELYQSYLPDTPLPSRFISALEMKIDPDKIEEIHIGGMRPVTISPSGDYIFALGETSGAVYKIETGEFVFHEPFENLSLDFPAVSWSPDSSQIAFNEDFFRRFLDGDIHIIDTEENRQINLTEDGVETVNPGRSTQPVDIFLCWLERGDEFLFLRINLSNSVNIMKYDMTSDTIETISPSLSDRPSIVNGVMDMTTGRIYYTLYGRPDAKETGIWLLDPGISRPVQLIRQESPRQSPPIVTDISLNGEWLMIYFPMVNIEQNRDFQSLAFKLYHLPSGTFIPILRKDDFESMIINNAVFSPDGSKVLFVYGSRDKEERHISLVDVGSDEVNIFFSINDPAAGLSPGMSGPGGVIGLDWCNDDTFYISVEYGEKALILRH